MLKNRLPKRIYEDRRFPYLRVTLILLVVVSLALVYVWQRISVMKSAREIQDLKNQLSRCKEEYKYLSLDVTCMSSAENIQRIAQTRLDMLPADNLQVFFVLEPKLPSYDKHNSFLSAAKKIALKIIPLSETKVEAKEVRHDL